MAWLDSALAWLTTLQGQATAIAFVLEVLFRFIKTPVPLSIAWIVAGVLKKLGDLVGGIAKFLDTILPQRTG